MSDETQNSKLKTQNVFLIGYRGTGKTTVAACLARRLDWPWIDADAHLERIAGRTIRELFASEGEAGFRLRESAVLEELCRRKNHIIATGGGVVLAAGNRERLKQSGRVIWLTADPETIRRRIESDPSTAARRPVLSVGGLAEIEQLLTVREPWYRACADLIVETTDRSPEEIAEAVFRSLTPG
jgi:shikimate kinase